MRTFGTAALIVFVLAAAACGGQHRSLSIQVAPRSATLDVPFTIRVEGLPARRRTLITFSGRAVDGKIARGQISVRPDAAGHVRIRDRYLYPQLNALAGWPKNLRISVSSGGDTVSELATRAPVDPATLLTSFEDPAKVGFYGEWVRPKRAHRHTAILLFGGSEGGLAQQSVATTLAAHGYPVLHLAYFGEPGLPRALLRIPLEYFEHALEWLRRQPAADPKRIVTLGWSRGGEASLIVASTFPKLVDAAVGYVPSASIVRSPVRLFAPAWTYRGRPFHGDTYIDVPRTYGWIRVERVSGPVFVVGGGDDRLWASGSSVAALKMRMLAHHRRDITALIYPSAGHAIAAVVPPQILPSSVGYGVVQSRYGVLNLGGSPRADEGALESSWPKLLRFLRML